MTVWSSSDNLNFKVNMLKFKYILFGFNQTTIDMLTLNNQNLSDIHTYKDLYYIVVSCNDLYDR